MRLTLSLLQRWGGHANGDTLSKAQDYLRLFVSCKGTWLYLTEQTSKTTVLVAAFPLRNPRSVFVSVRAVTGVLNWKIFENIATIPLSGCPRSDYTRWDRFEGGHDSASNLYQQIAK